MSMKNSNAIIGNRYRDFPVCSAPPRLNQLAVDKINKMQSQLDSAVIINENIRQIQRGINECQHTF
jgi:hypothetical protein